jgi:antitoxin FitA
MGELTIRLDDAKLIQALEEMASVHGKPLEDEVRAVLERAVEEHARRMDLVRRADEIAAMTPKGVKQTDSSLLIREDRDR